MKSAIICLFLAIFLSACGPDLTVYDGDVPGYCRVDDSGNLIVSIKNEGNRDSAKCRTQVLFGTLGGIIIETPPVPKNGIVNLDYIKMPFGCYDPDCQFTIDVDYDNQIKETDETNNIVQGVCIG